MLVNKKVFKFAAIAFVLLSILYFVALNLDMLGTGILTFLFLIFYFIPVGIMSAIQVLRKKETRTNLIIAIGCFIASVASVYIVMVVCDQGLRELTAKRMELFKELRPVLLKYQKEHGSFPNMLEDLVPGYLNKVPSELINDGKEDPYKSISYETRGGEAYFSFRRVRGPDSGSIYFVSEDRYEYNE